MSPDAGVTSLVDRAVRRARVILAAESAAFGAAFAAWSVAAGFVVAVVFATWRSARVSRRAVVRALERSAPVSRNTLTTAEELSTGALSAKPAIRERVMEEAAAIGRGVDVRAAIPATGVLRAAVVAVAAWTAVSTFHAWRSAPVRQAAAPGRATSPAATAQAGLQVTVDVNPPQYTGRAPSHSIDPARIEAVENSAVTLTVDSSDANARVETGESSIQLKPDAGGRFEHHAILKKSGYFLVTSASGARRMIAVAVTPDALPDVRLVQPGRDLVYSGGNPRIVFDAKAADDYGLRSLVLRYTKVSGSGEQFEFKDGEIPLTLSKTNDREWQGSVARSLSQLDLHEGDMLVYRAVAADARPDGLEASSEAFFVEVSRLGVAAGDAFTLPEQETRYALSQQMLIVKTERLEQRRRAMPPDEVAEVSQGLAVEQRMIRSEFVFMLGGEIEDEEAEAEQSTELQAGRLANRGQRDLRAATVAMSQAEKFLTAADTSEALKAERAAVAALQRAFSRERYILRALATRSQLDLSRRLTGTATPGGDWRRLAAPAPATRRAALLQSLLQGLGDAARAAPDGSAERRSSLVVLAELAVRTDTESAALRAIASDLQQLADGWIASSEEARRRSVDAIAARVAAEARRTLADPPVFVEGPR